MKQVKGDAGCPVGEGGPGTSSQVGQGAQGPEAETEGAAGRRPHQGRLFTPPSQQQYDSRPQGPDVQVAHPPQMEAEDQSLQQDKGEDDIEHVPAEDQGVHQHQQGDRLDIGQGGHGQLEDRHNGGKQGAQHQAAAGCPQTVHCRQ